MNKALLALCLMLATTAAQAAPYFSAFIQKSYGDYYLEQRFINETDFDAIEAYINPDNQYLELNFTPTAANEFTQKGIWGLHIYPATGETLSAGQYFNDLQQEGAPSFTIWGNELPSATGGDFDIERYTVDAFGNLETLSLTFTQRDPLSEDLLLIGYFRYSTLGPIAPIPEPSTYGMLALGLGLIGLARRRQR